MLDSNHGDECSSSGSSFPSLKLIHSQEEENIIDGTTTISGEIDSIFTDTYNLIDACGMVRHAEVQNPSYGNDDENGVGGPTDDGYITEDGYTTLDGYPTDERTAHSFYQSKDKDKERVRLNILELARKSLATKKTTEILGDEQNINDSYFVANVDAEDVEHQPLKDPSGESDVDDCSFLANVDVEDAEIKQHPKDSDREQYVCGFSFLTTVNGGVVEEQPDDSSFIVGAGVEDVPGDIQSIGDSMGGTAASSYYDIHASTLSRASASTRISIGDMILKESNMAAQMVRSDSNVDRNLDTNTAGEDQSASTYSYRRAYIDTVTLASNYTSTLSALTDDNLFHARRTGMSEAIKANPIQEDPSFESGETSQHSQPRRGDEIKRSHSGPADVDTGALISQSDNSIEESLARPPPIHLFDQATDFVTYENADHLKRMLSYGEGHDNVDEVAARIFTSSDQPNDAKGSCVWLTSSSRLVKLCVMFSILLLLTSVASLALALLLPEQFNFGEKIEKGHVSSSRHNDVATLASTNSSKSDAVIESANSTPTINSTDLPSAFPLYEPSNRSTPLPTADPTPRPSAALIAKPTARPTHIPSETIDPTMKPMSLLPTTNAPTQARSVPQVTLQAAKDTCINEEYPNVNYGASEELRVDGSPKSWSIITFDGSSAISNIARIQRLGHPATENEPRKMQTFPVLQAKLRLYTLDQGGDTMVFSLPHAQQWAETSLTWNNEDQIDRSGEFQLGSLGWAAPFSWNEIDVTDAFASGIGTDFLLSFAIVSDSTNGVTYASRERDSGSFSPELVLTFVDGKDILSNPPSPAPEALFRTMTTLVPTYSPTLAPT